MSKVYVASSWRNVFQQDTVDIIRRAGHEVYDFRNPRPGNTGFSWDQVDPCWKSWSTKEYIHALKHPIAQQGFNSDLNAMKWADHFVLVMPSGRSAHLEAGWAIGAGKPTAILLLGDVAEPELMYKLADVTGLITTSISSVLTWLQ